jgi:UDPglucose 6-dehydrogenase
MRLTVFGAGYVGLVTGACFADMGNHVTLVDVDVARIEGLKRGKVPIYEPGLDAIIARSSLDGRMAFTTDAAAAIASAEVLFIAVGTPPSEDGSADLQHVLAVAQTIGQHMLKRTVVVDKSTVPVGTADRVREAIAAELTRRGVQIDFAVASNPEFLKEGAAIDDFMRPDRIVVGCEDLDAIATLKSLYAPFSRNHEKLIVMGTRSAELTKYAANAMLAVRISFMNEMAKLAERLGGDIEEVRRGIGSDPRIGPGFLYAGAGFGGSCFPKDLQALRNMGQANACLLQVVDAAYRANEVQKRVLFDKVVARLGRAGLAGKRFAVWGLAFKPDTDDMREAPSKVLIDALLEAGATVRAFDPEALETARAAFGDCPGLELVDEPYGALKGASALFVVTEWRQFRSPDFDRIRDLLEQPIVFDGRNLYQGATLARKGLEYHGIGRGFDQS